MLFRVVLYTQSFVVVSFKFGFRTVLISQRAKKVVSDSPGLVDFAIGLVMFVLNFPDWQVLFFLGGNLNYRRIVMNPANQRGFLG